MNEIKRPQIPRPIKAKKLSRYAKKRRAKWKKLFTDLGASVEFEEDSNGAVKIEEGNIMQALIGSIPFNHDDSPYIEIMFSLNNKASIEFFMHDPSWDEWLKELGVESPINPNEKTETTWEGAYKLLVKYLEFIENSVPEIPELN